MKGFYSCAELAAMKLQSMPHSKKGFIDLVNREGWSAQKREGRGGGLEYQPTKKVMDLIKAQALGHAVENVKQPLTIQQDSTDLTLKTDNTSLKDWQRNTAEARLAICQEVKRLAAIGGRDAAIMKMVNMAANETLPEHLVSMVSKANARSGREGKRTLSRRSIYRWLQDSENGFNALAPKSVEKMDIPAWAPYLMALYGQPQKPTLAYCLEVLSSKLPAHIEPPSYSAANRFIKKMSNVDAQKGRMGSREIKNIKPFVRRDTSQMWPTDVYTADGHTFDAEVAHPSHSKAFKPELTTVLDVGTRRCVGWSTGLAETTWGVVDALRHACVGNGIPAIFYVDNGSGFKNAAMSNEATGFMARLSITLKHSLPYNSQARGIEERSHQSIWVRGAKTLSTYMGADMDRQAMQKAHKVTRKELALVGKSSRLMPWSLFIEWCQEQVDDYNSRPHRGLPKFYDAEGKKRHMSPNEAWEQAVSEGFKPVMVEPHEADDLFRPYKEAVTRRGEITLHTNTYFSHDLAPYHGETMRVGYDIHDASRVWVRNQAGQLICVAEFEANKRGYYPQSILEQSAEKRAKGRIQRAQIKIDEAEQELNPPMQIVHEEVMQIPAEHQNHFVEANETVEAENVVQLKTKSARPFFETDAQKYRWLMQSDAEMNEQDEAWIGWYKLTDEYEDLFDDRDVAIR